MDKFDKNSLLMAAGGAAIAGASMMAGQSIGGVEVTNDVLEVIETILKWIPPVAAFASAVGLARLAVKYGARFWNLIKEKMEQRSNTNKNELNKTHSKSNDTKSSTKGNMKEDLKSGYKRGLENSSRRSARNPVNRNVSKMVTTTKQVIR